MYTQDFYLIFIFNGQGEEVDANEIIIHGDSFAGMGKNYLDL